MTLRDNICTGLDTTSSDDTGFTIAELMLVSFFTLFVLILLYQMVFFAQAAQKQAEKNVLLTNEVSVPLDIMDRYFSQNIKITTLTDYSAYITVPTAPGGGTTIQLITIKLTADEGGSLQMVRNNPYAELDLSKKNANVSSGTPMFKMLDIKLNPTTDISKARSVVITVVAKGSPSGTPIQSSRTVYFRNR